MRLATDVLLSKDEVSERLLENVTNLLLIIISEGVLRTNHATVKLLVSWTLRRTAETIYVCAEDMEIHTATPAFDGN